VFCLGRSLICSCNKNTELLDENWSQWGVATLYWHLLFSGVTLYWPVCGVQRQTTRCESWQSWWSSGWVLAWYHHLIVHYRNVITTIKFIRKTRRSILHIYTHTSYRSILLTLYGHIETAERRTIIQQYGDWYTGRWWVGCYIWYSEEGPGQAAAPPSPRCTKCNSPPVNGQCSNFVLFDVAL